jgi:hypothetical protein
MTDAGWERLRLEHPWPAETPEVPPDEHGWLKASTIDALQLAMKRKPRYVLELGSWLGKSCRWFLGQSGDVRMICVDRWMPYLRRGDDPSSGIRSYGDPEKDMLWLCFIRNQWRLQERIVPIRLSTIGGMIAVHNAGVRPDLVYIDAEHGTPAVFSEILAARSLFPNTWIVGDDWQFDSVKAAVELAARCEKFTYRHNKHAWWIP